MKMKISCAFSCLVFCLLQGFGQPSSSINFPFAEIVNGSLLLPNGNHMYRFGTPGKPLTISGMNNLIQSGIQHSRKEVQLVPPKVKDTDRHYPKPPKVKDTDQRYTKPQKVKDTDRHYTELPKVKDTDRHYTKLPPRPPPVKYISNPTPDKTAPGKKTVENESVDDKSILYEEMFDNAIILDSPESVRRLIRSLPSVDKKSVENLLENLPSTYNGFVVYQRVISPNKLNKSGSVVSQNQRSRNSDDRNVVPPVKVDDNSLGLTKSIHGQKPHVVSKDKYHVNPSVTVKPSNFKSTASMRNNIPNTGVHHQVRSAFNSLYPGNFPTVMAMYNSPSKVGNVHTQKYPVDVPTVQSSFKPDAGSYPTFPMPIYPNMFPSYPMPVQKMLNSDNSTSLEGSEKSSSEQNPYSGSFVSFSPGNNFLYPGNSPIYPNMFQAYPMPMQKMLNYDNFSSYTGSRMSSSEQNPYRGSFVQNLPGNNFFYPGNYLNPSNPLTSFGNVWPFAPSYPVSDGMLDLSAFLSYPFNSGYPSSNDDITGLYSDNSIKTKEEKVSHTKESEENKPGSSNDAVLSTFPAYPGVFNQNIGYPNMFTQNNYDPRAAALQDIYRLMYPIYPQKRI